MAHPDLLAKIRLRQGHQHAALDHAADQLAVLAMANGAILHPPSDMDADTWLYALLSPDWRVQLTRAGWVNLWDPGLLSRPIGHNDRSFPNAGVFYAWLMKQPLSPHGVQVRQILMEIQQELKDSVTLLSEPTDASEPPGS